MSRAPQGALPLVDLPEQSHKHFDGLARRHGKTGAELAALVGRTGSNQALRNAWSMIKTGKRRLTPAEHAVLLLELGEHPAHRLTTADNHGENHD